MNDQEVVHDILCGVLNKKRWSRPRIVKVFIASTKTDFVEERRQLLEIVGPDLHSQLDALGIEVEMEDIHYGTDYDSALDVQLLESHMKEIDHCFQVSRGCFFMCLIGDRYGRVPLEERIKSSDYAEIQKKWQLEEEELSLLQKFYKKDGDYYKLQQPGKIDEDWEKTHQCLENIFTKRNTVRKSVLEEQLIHALGIHEDCKENIISVTRNWLNFNYDEDGNGVFKDDKKDQMESLRKLVQSFVPEENRFTFDVPWKKGGIDTDLDEHENYMSKFCEKISSRLHELISKHIKKDPEVKARNKNLQEVYNEVVSHFSINEKLNSNKNSSWAGSDTLNKIRHLMVSRYQAGESNRHLPIILQGSHMTGKTSIINEIYWNCSKWMDGECYRILRFANTTPRSNYNLELVRIIAHQLCYILNESFLPRDASFDPLYVNNWFQTLLRKAEESAGKIFIILIDDLHRLNPLDSDIVAALSWLPISLPYNVHIIATTFQPIEVLKLTPVQRERFKVPECLIECSTTLHEDHVKAIEKRFLSFEQIFGRLATSRLFNLISCTEFGLAETEILEILMPTNDITDIVLLENGQFNFSTLARAKYILGDLLVQKEMSGKVLLIWRHVLIKELAKKKYATGDDSSDVLKAVHAEIANLFYMEFTKSEDKIIEQSEKDKTENETKETPFQSILETVDVTYNIRHVEEAWLHLLNADSHIGLKRLCVCNFDMALAAVQTISVSYLRSLLEHVRSFLLDRDLELVYYTVRKSSQVLTKDALQLPTQFICWLRPVSEDSGDIVSQMITSAMAWCDGYTEPLLVPLNAWLQPPLPLQIKSLHVPGGVRLMEPTPSGQHLVIVPQSGDPQLWHIMTNALVHTFKGHSGPVGCVCVTKQLPYLVTGSDDTSVIVWDLTTFAMKLKIVEHIAPVLSLCVALNNTVIVSSGEDSRIIVTSIKTGEVVFKIDHHRGPVTSVKVTSTTDILVSGSVDGTICLWSLENKVTLLNTMQLVSPVLLMSLTEDSVFILASCEDNQLYLRTLATGTELHTLRGLKTKVQCIHLACDNRRAVVGGADGRVYIFDLHSGLITRTINSHVQCVTSVKVTDKDDFLITAGGTKVTFWSFRQEVEVMAKKPSSARNHTGHITCLCISRDGSIAATGGTDSLVNIWQMNSHELQCTMDGHSSAVTSVALAANGLFAVSGSEDHTARVWGLTLGLVVSVFRGHQTTVIIVSVMLDSRRVISCDRNGTISIWLADDATNLQTLTGTAGKCLEVSSNMKYAICAQNENSLRIWSLIRDDEKYTVSHADEISCFVITMDNTMVITGSKDQSLKVWQLAGGKLTQVLVGHTDHVTCVAVSMNKSQVISGSKDSNLIVWDVITGADLFTFTGHLGYVTCVQLSADGTLAISGSEDKSIIVWDVQKGRQLSSLTLHIPILGLRMASDASRIAVHLLESTSLPIICLHNTPATYVKLPTYIAPAKEVPAPDLRPGGGLKRPMRRLLKKEVSLDTYTWQKKYGHLTSNIMMAAVDERLKRRFSVSASMEEISKIPNQGSQQLGPEQAALAQSQHFDQLEALWNKRSPPRRRFQLSKQSSRQSDPATPLEEDPGLSE